MGPRLMEGSCRLWVHPRSKSAHGPRLWMGPRLMEGSCRLWVGTSKVQVGTRSSALDGSSAHGRVLSALGESIQGPRRHKGLGAGWVFGSWMGPVGSGSVHRLWIGP